MLSMPLRKLSRKVVFVNTDSPDTRAAVVKTKDQLRDMDDGDDDVFQKSVSDRFASRPNELNDMCLADFASLYATNYNEGN